MKMFKNRSVWQSQVTLFLTLAVTLYAPGVNFELASTNNRFTATTASQLRTAVSCYSCNATEACAAYQLTNYTTEKCEDSNAGCWIWITILVNETTVARGCRESCTDSNMEESCKEVMSMKFCSKCCSNSECNVEILSSRGTGIRCITSDILFIVLFAISTKSIA